MNGWKSTHLWFAVFMTVVTYLALRGGFINGAQFTILAGSAFTTFGARKIRQHWNGK